MHTKKKKKTVLENKKINIDWYFMVKTKPQIKSEEFDKIIINEAQQNNKCYCYWQRKETIPHIISE